MSAADFLIDWWREPEPAGGAAVDQGLLAQKLLAQFGIAPPIKESKNGK